MSNWSVTLVGVATILAQVAVLGGCSASTDPENAGGSSSSTAGGNSPSAGNLASSGGNPATGGTPSPSGGSATSASGSSATGGVSSGSTDPSCVSNATAKEGAACTQDCMVTCGHNQMGTKTCTCVSGIFDNCSCPRPPAYMGDPMAPLCSTPDGMTAGLKDMPCEVEWAQCIGADPTTGPTKQGCACLKEDATSPLKWECGSSNQWYSLAP